MMEFLGIVQFLIIVCIAIYEFKLKSPSVFLWATLLIMFGMMHLFTSITGDELYSDVVLIKASFFAIGFCCFYLFVRVLYVRSVGRKNTQSVFYYSTLQSKLHNETSYDSFLLFVFFCAIMLKLIPYIRYVGNIFSTSWSNGRDYSASLSYVNTDQVSRIFLYALSGLTALFYIRKDNKWILAASLIIIEVLLTRNRIEILPVLCSLIMVFAIKIDRLNLKTIIFVGLLAFFVVYLVYALRVFRHYGTIQEFLQTFDLKKFNDKVMLYLATDNGELGLRRDFYLFIDGKNRYPDFEQMHSYLRMLLVYLPTSWSLNLKPDDFAIAMGQAKGMAAGQSTHPTLFGDCFANAGYWGVFLGIFWAMYCNVTDEIIVRRKRAYTQVLLYVLNAVVYVIIGRGSIYNGFWFVAYGVPILIVMEWCFTHFRIPKFRFIR